MDSELEEIATYEWRTSTPYASPAHQVTPEFGPWGVPYWMQEHQFFQTTEWFTYSAPLPPTKSHIFHQVRPYLNAGQAPIGAAPTSGIYTGVEDSCQ